MYWMSTGGPANEHYRPVCSGGFEDTTSLKARWSTANGLATGSGAALEIPRACHCYSTLSWSSDSIIGLEACSPLLSFKFS